MPSQLILSIVVDTRSRVVTFIVIALVAYHYSTKQLRAKGVMIGAVVTVAVLPALGNFRVVGSEEFSVGAGWESLARRSILHERNSRSAASKSATAVECAAVRQSSIV